MNQDGRLGRELQGTVSGYLAVPVTNQGVGILLLHEQEGTSEQVQEACEQLARAGFVVLAPNLSAEELALGLAADDLEKTFEQVVSRLLGESAVSGARVGCLAFSSAAGLAVFGSLRNPRIGALALCHPVLPAAATRVLRKETSSEDLPRTRFLSFFLEPEKKLPGSEPEASADVATPEQIQSILGERFSATKLIQLENVRDGFMDESRPDRFDASAARECWLRLQEFFSAEIV